MKKYILLLLFGLLSQSSYPNFIKKLLNIHTPWYEKAMQFITEACDTSQQNSLIFALGTNNQSDQEMCAELKKIRLNEIALHEKHLTLVEKELHDREKFFKKMEHVAYGALAIGTTAVILAAVLAIQIWTEK